MLTTGFIFALCIVCLVLAWAWEVEKEKREDAERSYASMRSALRVIEREAYTVEVHWQGEAYRYKKWLEHIRGASIDPRGDAERAINGEAAPEKRQASRV
jgi:hypothetical protein